MKYIELVESLELELNKWDDGLTKPTTNEEEYFLNAAVEQFYKTRYSGMNIKQKGFEQDQKRIDDLRRLVVDKIYTSDEITESGITYSVDLPDNYILYLGSTAGIVPANDEAARCWDKDEDGNYIVHRSDTLEGTVYTLDRMLENSLSEHRLHYTAAKPIRLMAGDKINLYTDGNYKVSEYRLTYLRLPEKIQLLDREDMFEEYTDLPEHTHLEIVKLAAQLYIENQVDPRVRTYPQQVQTME